MNAKTNGRGANLHTTMSAGPGAIGNAPAREAIGRKPSRRQRSGQSDSDSWGLGGDSPIIGHPCVRSLDSGIHPTRLCPQPDLLPD